MKLKQLFENANSQFLQTRREIEAWLKKYEIENYTINDDLSVDVDGDVDITWKQLILPYIPIQFGIVSGFFDCSDNDLKTLKGAPREVGESFDCSFNQLTSLEFAPREVGRYFLCVNNQLTSLEGCPKDVGGNFDCSNNKLSTLKFIPKFVGRSFRCDNNPELSQDEIDEALSKLNLL